MIRSFLPVDLVIIPFMGGVPGDATKGESNRSWDEEEPMLFSLAGLFHPGPSPRVRRYAWVSAEWAGYRGLVSVRARCLPSVWEVEHLLVRNRDLRCCSSLLDRLNHVGAELGVETVFLRLPADSPFLPAAKDVGYSPYMTQHLYMRERIASRATSDEPPVHTKLRRRVAGDDHGLFQLYQRCVPMTIRRVEGLTLSEWQASRSPAMWQEWLFDGEGGIEGWLGVRARRQTGRFEVMAVSDEQLTGAVEHGLRLLDRRRRTLCLASGFQFGLFRLLEERGFSQVTTYCSMTKELTARARQPYLIPARA